MLKKYKNINFTKIFNSTLPVIVFDDNWVLDSNNIYKKTWNYIFHWIKKIINTYHNKKFIFYYDMSEDWNKYEEKWVNYWKDYTWLSSNNEYIKEWILSTNIFKIKEKLYKWETYYIQDVNNLKLKNTNFFKKIPDSMFLNSFYLIIEETILIYWHLNWGFWFIDITWKNWELMKELLKDFVKIKGLTWYANKLWKKYVNENKINIKLEKEE